MNIRILSLAFRKSQSTLAVPTVLSQAPLVQNNQYTKMAYLGRYALNSFKSNKLLKHFHHIILKLEECESLILEEKEVSEETL